MRSEAVETLRAALEAEREGYVRRGLSDRVQQVDEQLAQLGRKPTKRRATRRRGESQPKAEGGAA